MNWDHPKFIKFTLSFSYSGDTSDTARHSISGIMHGQNQNTPTGRGHGVKRSQRHELSKS